MQGREREGKDERASSMRKRGEKREQMKCELEKVKVRKERRKKRSRRNEKEEKDKTDREQKDGIGRRRVQVK